MSERRIRLLAAVLVLAAACADAPRAATDGVDTAGVTLDSAPEPPPLDTLAGAAPLPDTALAGAVQRLPGGRLMVAGETRAARVLEVTLEDGQRVLFGPVEVEVRDGRFQLEFIPEPTEQPTSSLYLTSPDGARQWVVALPAESASVRIGPQP